MIYSDYDKYDAMADEAEDKWNELVDRFLSPKVDEALAAVWRAQDRLEDEGEMPHPWTYERYLLDLYDCEDAIREQLEEDYREEAEDEAQDYAYDNQGPCCNDFHCPCGNSNNFRGL